MQPLSGRQCGATILGFPDDLVAVGLEHAPGAGAEARMVIDDQNRYSHGRILAHVRVQIHTADRTARAVTRTAAGS